MGLMDSIKRTIYRCSELVDDDSQSVNKKFRKYVNNGE